MSYGFTLDHELPAGVDTAVFDELAGYAHRYVAEQGERWGAPDVTVTVAITDRFVERVNAI